MTQYLIQLTILRHSSTVTVGFSLKWQLKLNVGLPEVDGKYVATHWYRAHHTYPYSSQEEVLHSHASKYSDMMSCNASDYHAHGHASTVSMDMSPNEIIQIQ